MQLLITGTSGRLGSALAQRLSHEHAIIGLDVVPGPYTTHLGSVTDRAQVFALAKGVDAILRTASWLPPICAITRDPRLSMSLSRGP
jgi:UDP-glucose 4-epimerase